MSLAMSDSGDVASCPSLSLPYSRWFRRTLAVSSEELKFRFNTKRLCLLWFCPPVAALLLLAAEECVVSKVAKFQDTLPQEEEGGKVKGS